MRVLALGCVLVVGCSSVFGLDGAKDDDLDGDRVPDAIDNCKDVPNPDQSDHDHNGIGDRCDGCASPDPTDTDQDGIPDACDGCDNNKPDDNGDGVPDVCEQIGDDPCPGCSACAIGPRHDEDHDLIPDGCDLCPSVATGIDDDLDGDGVGDKCDIDGSQNYQLFDSFVADNPDWVSRGPWSFDADQVTIVLGNQQGYRSLGAVGQDFSLSSRITATSGGMGSPAQPGLYAANNQNPAMATELLSCVLNLSGFANNFTMHAIYTDKTGTAMTMVTLPNPGPWTVRLQVSKNDLECTAIADAPGFTPLTTPGISGVVFNGFYPTGIGALGGGMATFDYVDLISSPP